MEENAAALDAVQNAIRALGRGFDVTCDTRLLYCKGVGGARVVEVDEDHTRELPVFGNLAVPNVPRDVRCSEGSTKRVSTAICSFHEMAEYFNRKALLSGSVPLGSFNCAFSHTGSVEIDASATKSLAMDGIFISLCEIQLVKYPFSLHEEVRRAVPLSWDPSSLASFIKNYGTHVVTSVTVGGKDVIYVKQQRSSPLSILDIKNYIRDLGDQRFSDNEVSTAPGPLKLKDKAADPGLFNSQGVHPQPLSSPFLAGKEDVTVIFRRQGGDELVQGHRDWTRTVHRMPDVIEMGFYPITCLLDGIPGKDHLVRAISQYLEYPSSVGSREERPPGAPAEGARLPVLAVQHDGREALREPRTGAGGQTAGDWLEAFAGGDEGEQAVRAGAASGLPPEDPRSPLGRPRGDRRAEMGRPGGAGQPVVRARQVEELLPCEHGPRGEQRGLHRRPGRRSHSHRRPARGLELRGQERPVHEAALSEGPRMLSPEVLLGSQLGESSCQGPWGLHGPELELQGCEGGVGQVCGPLRDEQGPAGPARPLGRHRGQAGGEQGEDHSESEVLVAEFLSCFPRNLCDSWQLEVSPCKVGEGLSFFLDFFISFFLLSFFLPSFRICNFSAPFEWGDQRNPPGSSLNCSNAA